MKTGPVAEETVRVIVADNTRMSSQLMVDAFRRDGRFEVLEPCCGVEDTLARVAENAPNVALISSTLEGDPRKGFEICSQLLEEREHLSVVILLDYSTPEMVVKAFALGARGVFCRANSIKALCKCIYTVHGGQIWATNEQLRYVMDSLSTALPYHLVEAKGVALLSKREQEVVRCVTEGLTNREIARQLNLSEHTIKNYMFRIFDKLGLSTRVEVVLYALSQRLQTRAAKSFSVNESAVPINQVKHAAEALDPAAQLHLARAYQDKSTPDNRLKALSWLTVAETTANYLAEQSREAAKRLRTEMTPDEVQEAHNRAAERFRSLRQNPFGEFTKSCVSDIGGIDILQPDTSMPRQN